LSAVPSSAADAVTYYHELLDDSGLLEDSVHVLAEGQQDRRLLFGAHPLSVSLRPRLIARATWERAVLAAEAIYEALGTLEQAVLTDPYLRSELDLPPAEERLALAPPGYAASSPSSRLDSFFADDIGYVEYNAESPAGMAYGDELTEVFDELPVMRRFAERFPVSRLPVRGHQLDAMLAVFWEWAHNTGHTDPPRIAIVDWPGLPTLTEFEMFQRFFGAAGIECCICDPTTMSWDGRILRGCDGKYVNLVYRRVLTSELIARGEAIQGLLDAYLVGAVCVVNSFRAKLLHTKTTLALLSDDSHGALFSAAQRDAINQFIPWTRKVSDGPTTRHGRIIPDLLAHIVARQRELVLKPNDEYGGKGVILGWTAVEGEWRQAVQIAATQSYVVQEAIPVPRECFPIALGGQLNLLDLAVDMDPYLFRGKVGGVLTRLSSSALLNVTAGEGSVVPTYVLENVD
jgi:hypothetical protein